MLYNAFVSYSHAADGKLAPAIQHALHAFAKPWYKLRALRVFRDKTSLSATPGLWPAIEQALGQSEWFLYLASPQAAQSHWVGQEIAWWITNRSCETMLVLLTDGELAWDDAANDFDWSCTTAAPASLRGRFSCEPLYVDLRWAKSEENLSLRNSHFRAAMLDVAAPIRGLPKDELDGDDVRQQRKNKRWAWSAGFTLAVLAVVIAGQLVAAQLKENAAARGRAAAARAEADSAVRLAVQKLSSDEPAEGLAFLARAIRADRGTSVARTLLYEQLVTRSWPLPIGEFRPRGRIDSAVFSKDGAHVAFRLGKTVEMWDVAREKRIGGVDARGDVAFAADGRTLLFQGDGSGPTETATALWNPWLGPPMTFEEIDPGNCVSKIFDVSANGKELLIEGCGAGLAVVSLRRERPRQELFGEELSGEEKGVDAGIALFFPDPRFVLVQFLPKDLDAAMFGGGALDNVFVVDRHAAAGKRLRRIPKVSALSISADGRRVLLYPVFPDEDETEENLEAWDVESWASAGAPFDNQSDLRWATLDATGGTILTTGEDGAIRLWDVETGTRWLEPVWLPDVNAAGFSSDGARIFAASDRVARWWGARDGVQLGAPIVEPKVLAAHLDDRGNIVTVSTTVRVWELATVVLPTVAAPSSRREWSLSADRKAALRGRVAYDTASGKPLWTAPKAFGADFQIDPQFSRAIVRNGGRRSIVDLKTWKSLWTLPGDASATFSDDGTVIRLLSTSTGEKRPVTMLSAATGVPLAPPIGRDWSVSEMSRDGSMLAAQSAGTLRVWDVRRGRVTLTDPEDDAAQFAFSDDGRQLAAVSSRGLRVWDLASGKARSAKWNARERLLRPKFSPDGSRLAVTSESGVVLCDVQTLHCADEVLAHAGVKELELSADGSRILTATGSDLRVWDVGTKQPLSLSLPRSNGRADTLAEIIEQTRHGAPVGLSPDGAFVISSDDRVLYRLPLPSIDDADADRLADIGEVLAGVRIDRAGVSKPFDVVKALTVLEEQCQGVEGHACTLIRWLRTPRPKRTISPISNVSVADYLELGERGWWWKKAHFPDQPGLGTKPPE